MTAPRRFPSWILVSLLCLLVLGPASPGALAQDPADSPDDPARSLFSGLSWRNIGPANMGGRIASVAVGRRAGVPDAIYVGTATGGLFRSSDHGASWDPVFDSVDGLMSIGAVAVAPSNPNLVWVGTGEPNNRQSSPWGEGVYRSLDGGKSWSRTGLENTRHIGRIVIHPADPDVVYVAAVGHLWGPNPERGVYRTTDGGETWEKVLFVDEDTGAIDLVMDPDDPRTLLAAMYQRRRKAWGFAGGGPGSGIYRTHDGGRTWRELTEGLPAGDKGRIGLDIFEGDGRIVYAIVEADPRGTPDEGRRGGVFRSMDRGDTWEQMNGLNPRPMYYSQIRVDPRDRQRVYVLGSSLHTSHDGGRTFSEGDEWEEGVHVDHHDLWIDPADSNHLLLGNDGGFYTSWSRGESWRFVDNLPIGEFYEIGVDMRDPYHVCGGTQDHGTWCIPSRNRDLLGISNNDAYVVSGGDGFYVRIDPNDPDVVYGESQGGNLRRFDHATAESQELQPAPREKPDDDEEDALRFDWNSPVVMSSFDPETIYIGAQVLFRSTDRGMSWEAISPDLTSGADRDTLTMMGSPVTEETLSRHDGTASYPNLTTVDESPLDPEVLYAGSDDGRLHVTRTGGETWTSIVENVPDLPEGTYVSRVEASHHDAGRVYATFDGHYDDDYRPYVYRSDDFGGSWESLVAGLPETSVNVIEEHPDNPRLLFLGHERGVSVSLDGGQRWRPLNLNMPPVPVDDLTVHPRDDDLIAGTHGRSIWLIDDIAPLEALSSEVMASPIRVLPGRPGRIYHEHRFSGWFWAGHFYAPNPEYGTGIAYWLSEPADGRVDIVIGDGNGRVVRRIDGPARRGLNRVYWDMRMRSEDAAAREQPTEDEEEEEPSGPTVLPGTYPVTVSLPGDGDRQATGEVEVERDPPLRRISEAEARVRQDALLDLYELETTLTAAEKQAETVTERLELLHERMSVADDVPEALRARADSLVGEASELVDEISGQARTVSGLAGDIDQYSGRPTEDQLRRVEWAFEDVTELTRRLNELILTGAPELYRAVEARSLSPDFGQPVDLPRPSPGGSR